MTEISCEKCGNPAQPKDLFCRKCGASLGAQTSTRDGSEPEAVVPVMNSNPANDLEEPPLVNSEKSEKSLPNSSKGLIGPPSPLPADQMVQPGMGVLTKRQSSRIGILLYVLVVLLIGLVVFRVFFFMGQVDQIQVTRNQYMDYWNKMSVKYMSQININPTPLGFKGDGLFNEAFDDEVAFDSNGLTNIDAHKAIGAFTTLFVVCLSEWSSSESYIQSYTRLGPHSFQDFFPGISLPTQVEMDELLTQCKVFGDRLVTSMAKANVAQWLGLFDMLIGLNAIFLLIVGAIWFNRKRLSKGTGNI